MDIKELDINKEDIHKTDTGKMDINKIDLDKMGIKKLTIIGLGLIGGSWGLALKRSCPEIVITGVDIEEDSLDQGIELGIIDKKNTSLIEGVKDADVVIISTLASSVIKVIKQISPFLKKGAVVTDTASTKANISLEIGTSLPSGVYYIGGHPMAGSEKQGVLGADPYLLENAVYVLTPESSTNQVALKKIETLVNLVGAKILYLPAKEHDEKVAAISHLPHLVASTLMNTVGKLESNQQGFFKLAAGGFRDVTRIADSHPLMWRDIFRENKEQVLSLIDSFKDSLEEIEQAIINVDEKPSAEDNLRDDKNKSQVNETSLHDGEDNFQDNRQDAHNNVQDEDHLLEFLTRAKKWREEVPQSSKGLLPVVFDVVVTVPDQPGIIGSLANFLGTEAINIMDIEILRVREGGEVLRFGFRTEDEAKRAVEVINQKGYLARARI